MDAGAPDRAVVMAGYLDDGRLGLRAPDAVVVRSADAPPTPAGSLHLGGIDVAVVEGGGAVEVVPHHRAPDGDGLVVGLVLAGTVSIEQRGRCVELGPGGLACYDGTTPYRVRSPGPHRYLVARVPLPLARFERAEVEPVVAVDLSSMRSAAVLAAVLASLAAEGAPVTARTAPHLADAVGACLRALLAEATTAGADGEPSIRHAALARWLDVHLAEDDASADGVARAHFLSDRYVRRVFAREGETVSAYVRRRRLEMIRQDLLDPALAHLPVSVIAARWGLRNASVFTRAFSAQYGTAPQRYRQTQGGRG